MNAGGEWNGPWSDGAEEWTDELQALLDYDFDDDGAFLGDVVAKHMMHARTVSIRTRTLQYAHKCTSS